MDFYQIAPSKIDVISVPIDIQDVPREESLHKRPYIICVSSFMPRKNQELLIRAFQNVMSGNDIDLIFIGRGGMYLNTCKAMVTDMFKSRILFKSDVNDVTLISYYQHALFSVYPSKYEGFGIPIIESIGYGCPILVSDNKTHLEVGEGYVAYFSSENQASLEGALLNLVENRDSIWTQQMRGREALLQKYRPDLINRKIISLYQSLLSV